MIFTTLFKSAQCADGFQDAERRERAVELAATTGKVHSSSRTGVTTAVALLSTPSSPHTHQVSVVAYFASIRSNTWTALAIARSMKYCSFIHGDSAEFAIPEAELRQLEQSDSAAAG